ncbi:MOSC domain-containing protein [Paracoccus jiaweipingae]|uniref:MOSC domain-containing protein n=1 Tax=unclassified Paracoccus (in: a-proteobacteria) TaxID=2688777 RepID=UPI00378A73A6
MPDKAVHHYPTNHGPRWRGQIGSRPALTPAGFGEDIQTTGMTGADMAMGNLFRLGAR